MDYTSLISDMKTYMLRTDPPYVTKIPDLIQQGIIRVYNNAKDLGFEITLNVDNVQANQSIINKVLKARQLCQEVRELAKKYTVTVEITVDVNKKCEKLPTGAYVPKGFYKTIYIKETKQVLKYYMPNIKPVYSDPEKYRIK